MEVKDVQNNAVESSPAAENNSAAETQEVDFSTHQREQNARDMEARRTGVKAAPQPKKEAPAASQGNENSEASAEENGEQDENSAPASEAGNKNPQEKPNQKPRGDANSRIRDLIATNKKLEADLQAAREGKTTKPAESSTAKPAEQPKALEEPKEPKFEDFNTLEEFEAANRKYTRDLVKYESERAIQAYQQGEKLKVAQAALKAELDKAREIYPNLDEVIVPAATAIISDEGIAAAVKEMIGDSPVMAHLLFTLGGDPKAMADFVDLARRNPSAAIRKLVVLEGEIQKELGKGKQAGEGKDAKDAPTRGADGKFTTEQKPEKKQANPTPAPPLEVGGNGSAPKDEVDAAVEAGDFNSYSAKANARDLARRKG